MENDDDLIVMTRNWPKATTAPTDKNKVIPAVLGIWNTSQIMIEIEENVAKSHSSGSFNFGPIVGN